MRVLRRVVLLAMLASTPAVAGGVEDLNRGRTVQVTIVSSTGASVAEAWRKLEGGGLKFNASATTVGSDKYATSQLGPREWEETTVSTRVEGVTRIDSTVGALAAMSPILVTIPPILTSAATAKEKAFRPGRPLFADVVLAVRSGARDRALLDWVKVAYNGQVARKDITVTLRNAGGIVLRVYKLFGAQPMTYNRTAFGDPTDPVEVVTVHVDRIEMTGLPKGSEGWLGETIGGADARRTVKTAPDRPVTYANAFVTRYTAGPITLGLEFPESLSFLPATSPDYMTK